MPPISRSSSPAKGGGSAGGVTQALTTGQVARRCRVSHQTAYVWAREGRLPGYQTPGRHGRVEVEEFQQFLRQHGMPAYPRLDLEARQRVLVVGDEEAVVATVRRGLSKLGYETEGAKDGFEAVLGLGRFRPQAVVVDLVMPGLDGFELCQAIRANPDTQEVAVVMLTGHGSPENQRHAQACGADVWLAKPYRLRGLGAALERLLKQGGYRRQTGG